MSEERPPSRWGLGDAAAGFVASLVLSSIAVGIVLGVTGEEEANDLSLGVTALLQIPLWLGLLGSVAWAGQRKGNGVVADFGFRARLADVPLGAAIGVVAQLVVIPLLYIPILELFGQDADEVSERAERLADKADGAAILLLAVVVVVVAPVVEELFYRGLLMRSLERRVGPGWALGLSSVVFALSHFRLIEVPALVVFGAAAGYVAQRTGRLGPAIFAHVAFNATAVISLS